MAYEMIEVRVEADKVGIITLNRPKQLNALNDQLMNELGQALQAFDADEAIGCMIMGGGKKIIEMAVIAEKLALCPPCGGCRQKISEFASADTKIFLCDEVGVQKTMTMDELLPLSFKTDILG